MSKKIKKIASIALPIAAAFIPGIGPLGMALAGAGGGLLGGGGLKGALIGGALGGIGGGMFGGAPGASGIGALDSLNSGIYGALNPIGSSITSGLSSLANGASSALGFGDMFGAAASGMPEQISGALSAADPSLLSGGAAIPAGSALSPGTESFLSGLSSGGGGAATAAADAGSSGGLLSKLVGGITNHPIQSAAAALAIGQALGGNKVGGEQTQQDVLAQMQQKQQQDQQFSQQTVDMLNSASTGRAPQVPNISDYYTYGQRPEASFFSQAKPIKFAFGGHVKRGTTSTADDVPALLSKGEYVIPAKMVTGLGGGINKKGAKKLDKARKMGSLKGALSNG